MDIVTNEYVSEGKHRTGTYRAAYDSRYGVFKIVGGDYGFVHNTSGGHIQYRHAANAYRLAAKLREWNKGE